MAGGTRIDAGVAASLAEEHAALRRVATLVASGAEPELVFQRATEEAARLVRVPSAGLVRFEQGDVGRVVGRTRLEGGPRGFEVGDLVPLKGETPLPRVYRTGQPARIDSYDEVSSEIAMVMRSMGFQGSVAIPIEVAGWPWGALIVATDDARPLPTDTEERLAEFGELVSLAVASAQAREELLASRARLVEASDTARRRFERDLHDGAQQRLVALALQLRAAAGKVRSEPDAAEALLDAASTELAEALEDLRELARGLHPAILAERGLGPALAVIAERCPVPVLIEAIPDQRLPGPIEAAAYFVVAESLTNVAKYAEATTARVRVTHALESLLIEIEDDGRGGTDPSKGSGLRGLADRVEALRGSLRVASAEGRGTLVSARLPLR
jgi:signal transduction histidine kinase